MAMLRKRDFVVFTCVRLVTVTVTVFHPSGTATHNQDLGSHISVAALRGRARIRHNRYIAVGCHKSQDEGFKLYNCLFCFSFWA